MTSRAVLLSIAFTLLASPASAQLPGGILDQGGLEVGYSISHFHRDVRLVAPEGWVAEDHDPGWTRTSLFGRFGVTGWLTLSAEGMIDPYYVDDTYPERDYRAYTLGLGLALRLYRTTRFDISFAARYLENLDYDRSPAAHHKNQRSLLAALRLERVFRLDKIRATAWIGPAYVYNRLSENPRPGRHFVYESSGNLGALVGGDALFFEHLKPTLELVYADYVQPRVGLAYQF